MAMITLIISGDYKDAFAAADEHNVELTSITRLSQGDIFATCYDAASVNVIRWFNENPGAAPFPDGTLLYFTQTGVQYLRHS
jgi:hypothetical protein